LRDESALGGIVTLSFQSSPCKTMTQSTADQADFKGSYRGTIVTSVSQPSSLVPIQE
jgi:hypothetical protein